MRAITLLTTLCLVMPIGWAQSPFNITNITCCLNDTCPDNPICLGSCCKNQTCELIFEPLCTLKCCENENCNTTEQIKDCPKFQEPTCCLSVDDSNTCTANELKYCTRNPVITKPKARRAFGTCIVIMLLLYAILYAAIIHNTIRYVIMQKRYVFHISYFYAVVIATITLRMCFFFSLLLFLINDADEAKSFTAMPNYIFYLDTYATYTSLILGLQWLCSMSELSTMISLSKLIQEYNEDNTEEIEKKQNKLLGTQKAAVNSTVIASVLLLIIVTWINFT